MPEVVEGELCLLEVLEAMRCVLLCILEAVEGGLCFGRCRRAGDAVGDALCALLYAVKVRSVCGGVGSVGGTGRDTLCATLYVGGDALCAALYTGGCGGLGLF